MTTRIRRLHMKLLSGVAAVALSTTAAFADGALISLPKQPLAESLKDVARVTGVNVLFTPDAVAGVQAQALNGQMTARLAVEALLAGSNLEVVSDANGGLIVRRRQSADSGSAPAASTRSANLSATPSVAAQQDAEGGRGSASAEQPPVERIVVTGTHIKGGNRTRPVTTVTRDDIEKQGINDADGLVRALPGAIVSNSPALANTTSNNNGFGTGVDLRGLGGDATLTLINGRRMAPAGGSRGGFTDISSIPFVAIERIEVLPDGASAIYGSEAVGGVVNFILRSDYEGFQVSGRYGSGAHESDDYTVSAVGGLRWETGGILGVIQHRHVDPVNGLDVGLTTMDLRSRGGSDWRTSGFGRPGTVYDILGIGLPGSGAPFAAIPTGQNGSNLLPSQVLPFQMSMSDTPIRQLTPEDTQTSGFLTFEQQLGSLATLSVDFLASERETPLSSDFGIPVFVVVSPLNPFNKFGVPVLVGYRADEFGGLQGEGNTKVTLLNAELQGDLFGPDWSWTLGGTLGTDYTKATQGPIPDDAAIAAAADSTNPANAFNPFGDGSLQPGNLRALYDIVEVKTTSRSDSAYGRLNGSLFELAGGDVRAVAGFDVRHESLRQVSFADGVVSTLGFFQNNTNPDRDITAFYAEAVAPIVSPEMGLSLIHRLDFSVAARYEDYSDFGNTTNPLLSAAYAPIEPLTFRASWGTSFRAPRLSELYQQQRTLPTPIFDPRKPGGPGVVVVQYSLGGNPDLQPEEADTVRIGATFAPKSEPRLRADIAWFDIDYTNRIRGFSDGFRLQQIIQNELSMPPGTVVRNASGNLVSVKGLNLNIAGVELSGWDFSLLYGFDVDAVALNFNLGGTILDKAEERLTPGSTPFEFGGIFGEVADLKLNGGVSAGWQDLSLWLGFTHVGDQTYLFNDPVTGAARRQSMDAYTTWNTSLGWSPKAESGWTDGLRFQLGVNNLFDDEPQFIDRPGTNGWDVANYDVRGRVVYFQITKAFEQQ